MKSLFIALLICLPTIYSNSQILEQYDPQILYEQPGSLYDEDSLRSISIVFEDPNYHTMLVDSFLNGTSVPPGRLPATLTLNGISWDSVGVRYKGNSTFCLPNDNGNPKVPYNIDMNYWIPGQQLGGFNKLKLANAWLDATFTREITASNIYRKYLPTPEANLMQLNVQGNYLGLFVNTESINLQFLKKHFGEKNGPLFKCDNANMFCGPTVPTATQPNLNWLNADSSTYYDTYTIKSENGWSELLGLIYTLKFEPEKLDSVLNIDRVLWAFAVNTVIANYDTYNGYYVHNYYMYQTEDGLFQMVPWDLSESYLNALLGWDINSAPQDDPCFIDPYYGDGLTGRPLVYYLLNHPVYRNQFSAHLRTVLNELDINALESEINVLQSLSYNAALTDNNKLFNMSQFVSNVQDDLAFPAWGGFGFGGILSTLNKRLTFLNNHPEISLSPPVISNVQVVDGIVSAIVSNVDSVQIKATISPYNSMFETFAMNDEGVNGDEFASDGVYSAPLPFISSQSTVKFYIQADNANAMMLSPERAEYEFYYYLNAPDSNVNLPETISIYPNPTNGSFTVNSNKYPLSYSLYTSIGQLVEQGVIDELHNTIDLTHHASKLYFLHIDNDIHKIVKVRNY